jgi:hypothetical protein
MKNICKFWVLLPVCAIFIVATSSCASSKGCHTKGVYVDKSVKKAQAKPKSY